MSQELERVYTINLGKVLLSPNNQRAKRAINMVREFARHHMKTQEIKIESELNHNIWERGIRHPPRKIRVRMTKTDEGYILVSPYESKETEKKDEKKAKKKEKKETKPKEAVSSKEEITKEPEKKVTEVKEESKPKKQEKQVQEKIKQDTKLKESKKEEKRPTKKESKPKKPAKKD